MFGVVRQDCFAAAIEIAMRLAQAKDFLLRLELKAERPKIFCALYARSRQHQQGFTVTF